MKLLLAIVLVAACGFAQAKEKSVATAPAHTAQAMASEAPEAATKTPSRTGGDTPKPAVPKAEHYASRDPYNVPLFRDARAMR